MRRRIADILAAEDFALCISLFPFLPETLVFILLVNVTSEQALDLATKSAIIDILFPLLCSQLTAGAAIEPAASIQAISPQSTLLADSADTHCSSDYASYGRVEYGFHCALAVTDMLTKDQAFTTIPDMYPIDFLSSTAAPSALGNGIRTPRRYTFGESAIERDGGCRDDQLQNLTRNRPM